MRHHLYKSTWLLTGLLLALVILPGTAAPEPESGPEPRSPTAELNLSPQQRERLDALSARTRALNRELGRQLQSRKVELDGLYRRFELDEPRARRLRQEIHAVQGQMLEVHHTFQVELRKILTPEQFSRLQEAHRRRRGIPGRWRRGGGPGIPAVPIVPAAREADRTGPFTGRSPVSPLEAL